MGGRPLQFQQQHLFIAHPASATQHGFDRGIDGFDDTKADR
jgi:hypothetical protein